jgi:hypothetical protein
MLLALCRTGRGEDVTYAFTGTGAHGTLAWGRFTTSEVLYPGAYEPGGIYSSFFLTISNIPGPGPGGVKRFDELSLELYSAFSMSTNGVLAIVPIGRHFYDGFPGHHYDLGGGVESNQSTLVYDGQYCDDITWSGLTIISPPSPPVLSAQLAAAGFTLLWSTNAVNFALEETASLTAPINWTTVTNVPVTAGGNFSVTLPDAGDGAHFFRLEWLGP